MAVMAREVWTDERLDDLNKRVDEGFKETREEFRAVRAEMRSEFQAVRAEMKGEFQAVRGELGGQIAALHRTTLRLFVGLTVTVALGFGGMIVTYLTQS
jgi:predicted phage gp36 major capsid-like protein